MERYSINTCALCGESEPVPGSEVCGPCGSDARMLGQDAAFLAPNAHEKAVEEVPDWAERHREAQVSGEVFAGGKYQDR